MTTQIVEFPVIKPDRRIYVLLFSTLPHPLKLFMYGWFVG